MQREPRHATLIGALLCILIALAATPARAFFRLTPPEDLTFLVKSELAESDGDGLAAIAWAESLAAMESETNAFGHARVATLHEGMGQDDEALRWGELALARDSLNLDAAMLVARMRLRGGESEIAAQVLTPPLRSLGAPPEAYALRALAHELSRRYEAALADLKRTDVLLPDFAWIATGILSLALEDGRLDEAYPALQLALELKPEDPRVLMLGITLAQRLENRVLEETLLRALAILPESKPSDVAAYAAFLARSGKGGAFNLLSDWAEARGLNRDDLRVEAGHLLVRQGHYRAAIALVKPLKKDPRAVPIRARAHVSLGEDRKALESYRKLIPERGLSREESLIVAYLEIRVGDVKRGVQTLEGVRAGTLETTREVLAASLCYSLLGHPEEAVALIRESAARGLTSPSIYEELGAAASVLGDSLVAQWAFERLRELGRETSECLTFLATAELSRGDRDQALATLERAVRMNPRNGRALTLLGRTRYERGQLEMARETLQRAAGCPETVSEANRVLAKVCRSLKLETEAREAESRARSNRSTPAAGLTLFQHR